MTISTSKNLSLARKLYHTAFPKEEQLPWWILRCTTIHKDTVITSYYHGNEFIGFTHTTEAKDILFVMFFAVREDIRNQGFGSAILEHIKRAYPGHAIVLNVEPLDDQAQNAQQRILRMRFYQKNGFHDTGYNIAEVGGIFRVLSTERNLNIEDYWKVFRKLSCGFWRPDITKVE